MIDREALRKLASLWSIPVWMSEGQTDHPAELARGVLDLITEVARLEARQQELLAAMVRLTNETPFADEANQVPTLIAKIGTLKAALREACDIADDVAALGPPSRIDALRKEAE